MGPEREGRWSATPPGPSGHQPCRLCPSSAPEPYRVRKGALGLQHLRPSLRPGPRAEPSNPGCGHGDSDAPAPTYLLPRCAATLD